MGNQAISLKFGSESPENFINGVKLDSSGAFGPGMDSLIRSKDWNLILRLLNDNKSVANMKHPGTDQFLLSRAICRQLHKDIILTLIDLNPTACMGIDKNGWLAIHHACCNLCAADVISKLLEVYPESVRLADSQGQTCLHFATKYKLPTESVAILLDHYPEAVFARTRLGALPLHFATQNRQSVDVIRMLVEANSIALTESLDGRQPIHLACESRADVEILKVLLYAREGSAKERSTNLMLPLHICAASKAELETVSLLVELYPEALLEKDRTARLPLHYALERQSPNNVVRHLLKSCPDSACIRGYGGNLPLHIALEKQLPHEIIIELLDAYPTAAEIKDMYGVTPLIRTVNNLADKELILKVLENNPDAASEIDNFDRMPLHYAIGKKLDLEVVSALLETYPIAAARPDRNKQLPLHIAVKRQSPLPMIRMLFNAYREGLFFKDEYGLTPLHHAIEVEGSFAMVELMLQFDKRCAQDRFVDQIALHLAIELKRFDLVPILLRAYPEAASDTQSECLRLPVQAAIHARASFELILEIFNANRDACAKHYDANGMLTIHYAVKYRQPVELVAELIKLDPEIVYLHDLPIYSQASEQPVFKRKQLVAASSKLRADGSKSIGTATGDAIGGNSNSSSLSTRPSTSPAGLTSSTSSPRFLTSRLTSFKVDFRAGSYNTKERIRYEENDPLREHESSSGSDSESDNDSYEHGHVHNSNDAGSNEKDSELAKAAAAATVAAESADDPHASNPLHHRHHHHHHHQKQQKVKLVRSKTLLNYAIDVANANNAVVAEILKHTMPISYSTGLLNPRHNYCWSYVIAETEDKYWEAVEMVLQEYDAMRDIELIKKLSDSPDEIGRKAIDIATHHCQRALLRRLYFFVRYELHPLPYVHVSSQSIVQLANDHHDGKKLVALKFMKNRTHFDREVHVRSHHNLGGDCVIRLLRYHDGDADPKFKEELVRKDKLEYPYVLVMSAAERPLVDAMLHENFTGGRNWETIRTITRQLCESISYFHQQGIIHGDIRPINIVREGGRMKFISLGECVSFVDHDIISIGDHIVSSAFLPPELFSQHASLSAAATLLSNLPKQSEAAIAPVGQGHGRRLGVSVGWSEGSEAETDADAEAGAGAISIVSGRYKVARKSLCVKTGLSFDEKKHLSSNVSKQANAINAKSKSVLPISNRIDSSPDKAVGNTEHTGAITGSEHDHGFAQTSIYDLPDRLPLGEYSMASQAIDIWSLGATLYSICAGEPLFLSSIDDSIDSLQLTMLADWTDGLKEQRIGRVTDCYARNLLTQMLQKDPSRRPSMEAVLRHPFLSNRRPHRFAGMPAEYDVCIILRHKQRNPSKNVSFSQTGDGDDEDEEEDSFISSNSEGDTRLSEAAKKKEFSIAEKLEMCENLHASWLMKLFRARGLRVSVCDSECVNLVKSRSAVVLLSRFAVNIPENALDSMQKETDFDLYLCQLRVALELPELGLLENGILCIRIGDRNDVYPSEAALQEVEEIDMRLAVPNKASIRKVLGASPWSPSRIGVQQNELETTPFTYDALERAWSEYPDQEGSGELATSAILCSVAEDTMLQNFADVNEVKFGHYFLSYRGDQVGRHGGCHPAVMPNISLDLVDSKVLEIFDKENFGIPKQSQVHIAEIIRCISTSNPYDVVGSAALALHGAADFVVMALHRPTTVLPVPLRVAGYSSPTAEAATRIGSPISVPVQEVSGFPESRPFTANGVRPLSPLSPELMSKLGFVDIDGGNQTTTDYNNSISIASTQTTRRSPTQLQSDAESEADAVSRHNTKSIRVLSAFNGKATNGTNHSFRIIKESQKEVHFTAVAFSDNNAAMASTIAFLEQKVNAKDEENRYIMEELERTRELLKIRMEELNLLRAQSNMKPCDTL